MSWILGKCQGIGPGVWEIAKGFTENAKGQIPRDDKYFSRRNCFNCGENGQWAAECPNKGKATKDGRAKPEERPSGTP